MNYIKKIGKSTCFMSIFLICSLFIITLLNYFSLISGSLLSIFKIIIIVFTMLIGGFIMGKNSVTKGWLEGLKLGIIILVLFTFLNLIFYNNFELKTILYDVILIFCSMVGSMIGISKKANV